MSFVTLSNTMELWHLAAGSVATLVALAVVVWRVRGVESSVRALSGELNELARRPPQESQAQRELPTAREPTPLPRPPEEIDPASDVNEELERMIEAYQVLETRLRAAEDEAAQSRRVLLLFRDVTSGSALLEACNAAIATLAARPSDGSTPEESAEEVEPDAFADDPEHKRAARIARVMVADLFLYNQERIRTAPTNVEVEALLKSQLRGARTTFENRVPQRVRSEMDHLALELSRALSQRTPGGLDSAAAPGAPTEARDEHADASQMAKLMVARLLLANRTLVERATRNEDLREALDGQYQTAREEFESSVSEPVWKRKHYLEEELRRVVEDWDVRHSLDSELNRLFQEQFEQEP